MAVKKIEILPCLKCKELPVVTPIPSADFPIDFIARCKCTAHHHRLTYNSIALREGAYRRKASSIHCIKRWNKRNTDTAGLSNLPEPPVTCKFCGLSGLFWSKRRYVCPWKKRKNYVLYESIYEPNTPVTPYPRQIIFNMKSGGQPLHIHNVKYKRHNCLARKNIVDIKYIKE